MLVKGNAVEESSKPRPRTITDKENRPKTDSAFHRNLTDSRVHCHANAV